MKACHGQIAERILTGFQSEFVFVTEFDFQNLCIEVLGSKMASNASKIDRKIDKMLLEYRVKNPQMDAPNGLRENRKLLINQ